MINHLGLPLPNLFIVGAQKAGTTTLHEYLSSSRHIFLPSVKEPGFFMKTGDSGHFVTPAGVMLQSQRPYATLEEYCQLYRAGAEHPWRGDATTGYLQSGHGRRKIREWVPHARIIICLREPVSRAYSAYNWARKIGVEPCESFEEALECEEERRAQGYWFWFDYTGTSRYATKIREWQDDFTHVKLVLFEDIRDRPRDVVRELLGWLGVEQSAAERIQPVVKNPSGIPRSALAREVRRLISPPERARGPIARFAKAALNSDAVRRIRRSIAERVDRDLVLPPKLAENTRALLKSSFADDVAEVEAIVGKDLTEWRQ